MTFVGLYVIILLKTFKGGYFMPIKKKYVIEKSNFLIELKNTNMTLQELRFFCIYLSKINARDVSTRCVCFPMSDFQKIMGLGKLNIRQLQKATNKLLCKVVNIPDSDGGYTGFTLFNLVRVFKDEFDNWNLEISASEQALPLFFGLKGNYLTYELWNILNLKSVNQIRMYELLKRYEKLHIYEIKVSDLREYLEISSDQYPQMERFKNRVLDNCQKALAENTDICYTYECGKRGSRGKWLTIIFHISKNDNHSAPMELNEFIDKQSQPKPDCVPDEQPEHEYSNQNVSFLAEACNNEFTEEQMNEILSIVSFMDSFIKQKCSDCPGDDIYVIRYRYLLNAYSRLNVQASKTEISNRYAYFKKIILNDYVEKSLNSNAEKPSKHKDNDNRDGFDFRKYDIFINDV